MTVVGYCEPVRDVGERVGVAVESVYFDPASGYGVKVGVWACLLLVDGFCCVGYAAKDEEHDCTHHDDNH